MCKNEKLTKLSVILALGLLAAQQALAATCTVTCVKCPADGQVNAVGASITVVRKSDGSTVFPGQSISACETLQIFTSVLYQPTIVVGGTVKTGFGFACGTGSLTVLNPTTESTTDVTPAGMSSTIVGPLPCGNATPLPTQQSMNEVDYTPTAADIAAGSISLSFNYINGVPMDGTCGGTVTGSAPFGPIPITPCSPIDLCHTASCDPVTLACVQVPVPCNPVDACHTASCDPATGNCVQTVIPCNPVDACHTASCDPVTGNCIQTAIPCNPVDACHTASCDPATGNCIQTAIPCNPTDKCHTASCDPATGNCIQTAIPCNPVDKCNTASCDPATGNCVQTPIPCTPSDKCHTASCDPATGNCNQTAIPCNPVDKCHTASCDPATGNCNQTAIPCTPIDNCHTASCDPATGNCVQTPNNSCQAGCTPGFWKNCTQQWGNTGFTTDQLVSSVFTVPACIGTPDLGSATLLQALSFKGGSTVNGAAQTLLRAAVAGLLNSVKVGYPLTTAQVISQVNAALASCDRATIIALASTIDGFNNLGCKDASGNDLPCHATSPLP